MEKRCISIGFLIFLSMLATLIWIPAQAIAIDREIGQDITGYLNRAESATTAIQMKEMLDNALNGLDNWGMHEGSWCWVYDTPDTRIEYSIIQIEDLRDRLQIIEDTENQCSMGYAESLEEIKRNFSNISIDCYKFYTLHYDILLFPDVGVLVWFLTLLIGIIFTYGFADTGLIPGRWVCKIRKHNYRGWNNCQRCGIRRLGDSDE